MRQREISSLVFLALILTAASCHMLYTNNYCRTLRKDLNETVIYNAYGAYEQYFLGDLFEGYNLTFSATIDDQDEELVNSISLEIDTEMELISRVDLDIKGKAIDVAYLQQTNGDTVFAVLDRDTSNGETSFKVRFGYAFSHSLFEIYQGAIPIPRQLNATCYQLTFIDEKRVLVDCEAPAQGSKFTDLYLIFDLTSSSRTEQFYQPAIPTLKALDREVKTLFRETETLILQAYLIDSFDDDVTGVTSDYVTIYRYREPEPDAPQYKEGYLERFKVLTGGEFNWTNLSIAEIQVLEERVFILDEFQGIASFEIVDGVGLSRQRVWDLNKLFQTGKMFGLAVDYDGGRLQFTIVCENEIKIIQLDSLDDEPEVVEQYPFDEPIIRKVRIQVSPKNLILQQGLSVVVYKRNRFDNSMIASELEDVGYVTLFDSEHLWVWRQSSIGVYLLQEPTLEILQSPYTDEEDPLPVRIKVSAVSQFEGVSSECSLVFYSSGVPASTEEIYFSHYREDEYKTHSGQDWQKYYIDREYVGPSVRFMVDYNQSDLSKLGGYVNDEDPIFVFSVPKIVDGEIEGAAPENFIFSAMIGFSQNVQIYIFQLKDFKLQFYTCFDKLQQTVYTQKCVQEGEDQLQSRIRLIADGILGGEAVIAMVEDAAPALVRFYDLSGQGIDILPFSKDGSNVLISSIVLQHNMLILVDQGDAKSVEVYEKNSQKFSLLYTINQKYVENWYQLKNPGSATPVAWDPLTVTAHYHHPNTFVVQQKSGLAVFISIEDRPKYLSHLNFTGLCADAKNLKCHFALTTDTFLLLRSDGVIKRYGIQDLTKPDYLFDFQFYDYKIFSQDSKDLHYAVSNYSGFVYVLAADPQNDNTTNLLIFRSNQEQIRTLYQAIEIFGELLNDQSQVCLSADGASGVDFAFVSVNGNYYSFRVPLRESIDILPNKLFPETGYTANFKLRYDAISMDKAMYEPVLLDILFVNDQTDIYINIATLEDIGFYDGLKPLQSYFPQKLQLYTIQRYFHGPVLGINISCAACTDLEDSDQPIRFVNRVQKSSKQVLSKTLNKVVSSYQHPETKTVYILQDSSVQAFTPNGYDLHPEYTSVSIKNTICTKSVICHQLVPVLGEYEKRIVYLLGICECEEIFYISVLQSQDEKDQNLRLVKFLNLADVQGNLFGMAQYTKERLFILFQSEQAVKNSIQVFDILNDIKDTKNISKSITKIDNTYLQLLYQGGDFLEITSFQVAPTDKANQSLIFITNATKNFFAIEIDDKTVKIIDPNSFRVDPGAYTFNFFDQLIDENQYVSETSKIVGIHVYDHYVTGKYINYEVLVLTTEIPIYLYEISLLIPGSNQLPLIVQPDMCGPVLAFGHYGVSTILHYVSQVDDYFAVAYYDAKQDSYTLAVYQEEQGLQRMKRGAISIPFIQMVGGYPFQQVQIEAGDDTLFGFLLYKNNENQNKLFAPDPNRNKGPLLIDINDQTYFEFRSNNFQTQPITITALTTQIDEDYIVSDQGIISPSGASSPKSKSDGWIIAVSVIGGVIFLGIIGFFGWKYYKSKKSEEPAEDGYSLQEPVRA